MMSSSTYILCPGQGAQAVGMGKDFYEKSPAAKEMFDRYKLPAFHDPFAGGGTIPLEAQRLGLES